MPLTMNARAWVATSRFSKVEKSKSGSPSEVKLINLPECLSKTSLPLIFILSNTKMTYKAAPLIYLLKLLQLFMNVLRTLFIYFLIYVNLEIQLPVNSYFHSM